MTTNDRVKDPREELVRVGQQLLDAVYEQHMKWQSIGVDSGLADHERKVLIHNLRETHDMLEIMDFTIEIMELHERIKQLNEKYILLRSTIEAMERPRSEEPTGFHDGHVGYSHQGPDGEQLI